jgi:zinc transport system substrate-binding protein
MPHAALAVLLLLLVACSPSSSADDEGLQVVATVYPLAWLAAEIAPDASVTSLAARGQDPHDLELTPQQRSAFESADLIAYLGPIDFQPQVEAAISGVSGEVVSAADIAGDDRLRHAGDDHPHEEDGDDGHDDDAEDDADETEIVDPHLWFDAAVMADIAVAMGEAFAAADPDNAEQYTATAAVVADDLTAVGEQIAGMLDACEHDEIIVSHEAYGYLLAPHGLEQHGISGAGGHSEASPADIAALTAEIREENIPAVLSEPVEGRTDAEAVAREAGVEIIEIYSLDIVDDEQAAEGFPALLVQQAEAVAQAAQCAGAS